MMSCHPLHRVCSVARFAVLVALVFTSGSLAAKEKKALYIGLDGVRFDAVATANTPHLDALIEQGIVDKATPVIGQRYRKNDTISGPGWSSILTGVWADKHGVHDNSFKGKQYAKHPHFFKLLKQQQPDAYTASFVTWKPIDDHIVDGADVHKAWEDKSKDYARYDTQAKEEAIRSLSEEKLDCLFLYFGQIDETGHRDGFHPSVKSYIAAIENVDAMIGEVLTTLKGRETYDQEDWIIVVTSDHGGQGTGHGNGQDIPEIYNSFLIVSGDSAQRGEFEEETYIVDAPATVLTHLGVALDEAWKLDGQPRGLK